MWLHQSIAGMSIAALSAAMFGANFWTPPNNLSQRIHACLLAREQAGYFDHDTTWEERRAIRLQFRLCVRSAVGFPGHNVSSHSNSSQTISSGVSTSRSSVSTSRSSTSSLSLSSASLSGLSSSRSSLSASSLSQNSVSSVASASSRSSVQSSNVSSVSTSAQSSLSAGAQVQANVEIEGFEFGPSFLVVKKGTTVRWTNNDQAGHTVTSDAFPGGPLNSPLLSQGQSYSYTFTKKGIYNYHCGPHPHMTGVVFVTN